MARNKSVPRDSFEARKCSSTRVEKKRSRDSSKQIPVRSSINMRISLNSCSLKPGTEPWRSLIIITFPLRYLALCDRDAASAGAGNYCLTKSANRDGPLGFFMRAGGSRLGRCTELRQPLVQLIGEFHKLAYGSHRAARTLGRLARNVRDNLHGVRYAFRAAHLLFRRKGDFLHQFG